MDVTGEGTRVRAGAVTTVVAESTSVRSFQAKGLPQHRTARQVVRTVPN
jgi:hypothetical protein